MYRDVKYICNSSIARTCLDRDSIVGELLRVIFNVEKSPASCRNYYTIETMSSTTEKSPVLWKLYTYSSQLSDHPSYLLTRNGTRVPSSPTNLGLGSIPLPISTCVSGPSFSSNTKFFTNTVKTAYMKLWQLSLMRQSRRIWNIPWTRPLQIPFQGRSSARLRTSIDVGDPELPAPPLVYHLPSAIVLARTLLRLHPKLQQNGW